MIKIIDVKSFTDRKGRKVVIGDKVGYFSIEGVMLSSGAVRRITKDGYFILVYTEGRTNPWYKVYIEKILTGGTTE